MRWEATASSRADVKRLTPAERERFFAAVRLFNDACDRWIETRGASWPSSLRVKPVVAAPGVFEMTWSFSGPDSRATWEWASSDVDGVVVPAVRWRRVGSHAIFANP